MTVDLAAKAEALRALHHGDEPLVLANVWDAAGARAVVEAGFDAVATSSGAVARSMGYEDHEEMPIDEAFAAIARITQAVDVPVTADIESGYGLSPTELVDRLLAAGAVGCNLEDTDHTTGAIRDVAANADRLAAVRVAAREAGVPIVMNARVDVFIADPSRLEVLDDAIERGRRYLEAGADCTYPIALAHSDAIARYVIETGAPVNVMLRRGIPPIAELAAIGVKRISAAAGIYRAQQAALATMLTALHHRDLRLLFGDA